MHSATALSVLALVAGTLAGYNCKCQDTRGQFNEATKVCCERDPQYPVSFYPGPNHQCANAFGGLDSGAFDKCCRSLGVEGSYCWK